jgi:chromosomal replication initiation ATPase DnaA
MNWFELSTADGTKSIAEIYDKKKQTAKKKKYVFIKKTDKRDQNERVLEFNIDDKNVELKPLNILQADNCPNRVCIFGKSGSGKSYFCKLLAKDYNEVYDKNKVAFFSRIEEDSSINEKNVKRFIKMRIDDTILEEPITLEELHDKMVIFDDIELFRDKEIKEELLNLQDECLLGGRHLNIFTVVTKHKILDGKKNCNIKNECHCFVGFLKGTAKRELQLFLKNYLCFEDQYIKKVMK